MKQKVYYCEVCKKRYKIPKEIPLETYIESHKKYHVQNPGKELNPDTLREKDKKILESTDTSDSLLRAAQGVWDDQQYLQDLFQLFLMSVQQNEPKDLQYKDNLAFVLAGSPKWNDKSTFEEFVRASQDVLRFKLEVQLPEKKKERKPILSGYREMVVDPNVKFNPIVGKPTTMEHVEVYEFMLRKSLEACTNFLAGKLQLLTTPVSEEVKA